MYTKSRDELELEARKAEHKDFKRWQKIVAAKRGWDANDSRLNRELINSERANQQTVIAATQINMHIVKVPYRMGRTDQGWDSKAVHYQVKIWIGGVESQGYVFSYSQGSGIKQFPTIREILFSVVQDGLLGSESFVNFCGNTGGEPDSRASFKTYETCVEFFEWFCLNQIYESRIVGIAHILQEAENAGDLNSETGSWMEPPIEDEDEIPF